MEAAGAKTPTTKDDHHTLLQACLRLAASPARKAARSAKAYDENVENLIYDAYAAYAAEVGQAPAKRQ